MKSKWVIQKLNTHAPSSKTFPLPSSRTQTNHSTFPKTLSFPLNHIELSTLLSSCGRQGNLNLGSTFHASIVKNHESFSHPSSVIVWNSLLFMYLKCRVLTDAVKVFDEMPLRDTVSWNTIICGFLSNGEFEIGLKLFKKMRESGFYGLDTATMTTVLSACDKPEMSNVVRIIHCLVFMYGFSKEVAVGNALITSCFKCGCFNEGRKVFDQMLEKNVVTWTAVISGLAQNGFYGDSLKLFGEMTHGLVEPNTLTYSSSLMACSGLRALWEGCQIHGVLFKLGMQSDLSVESALMDMYSKCGRVEDAWLIFESAEQLDEVSMTVILLGFAQNGFEEEATQIFLKMVKAGISIDPTMVSAVLGVFGADTSLVFGKQLHSLVIKRSFGRNVFVSNGLVNMYSKCGELAEALKVFSRMPVRNSVSWNAVITAFARHGNGSMVLRLYEDMRMHGVQPTDVTFLSLLHACSHVGLVDKGLEFLESMAETHGLIPRAEHYACVVDMLGRAGLLNEAKNFIEGLPVRADVLIWQALLGACSIHGEAELGKYAAEQLFTAASREPAPYVLLANMYSSKGKWKERAQTIKRMKEMGISKETGISWIEIDKKVHSFVVEDRMHQQADMIYRVLWELLLLMFDEGYIPDKRFIRYYLDKDKKD